LEEEKGMALNLKKDLQAVTKELKALEKKIDRMVVAVDKLEKPKAATAKPVKKAAVKKPVAKKTAKLTVADTVLAIIKRSKKGVDSVALKKKTGIKDNVLLNAVYKLKKQGKIKSERKGFYEKV